MSLTVVINAYWQSRFKNIPIIIESLNSGSVEPDEIIIFNNSGMKINGIDGYTQIVSDRNFGYRASYTSALLTNSDYYLSMDDDFAVEKNTIENLIKHGWGESVHTNVVLGLWGKNIQDNYRSGENIYARDITELTKTDLLVGRGMIVFDREALVNMIKLEQRLLFYNAEWDYSREQDILISMANQSYVIPAGKDQQTVDLGEHGVGYNREGGHYELRNNLVKTIRTLP